LSGFLRAAAALCLVWSIVLTAGRDLITTPAQQTALAQALAHGQGTAYLVFAFLFWNAAKESVPNRTVILGAALFLLLRVTTDLYDLLVLTESMNGLVSLADLVLCVGLAVGVIESMPRVLRPDQNEKGRGS
jgi:hypothetical protein